MIRKSATSSIFPNRDRLNILVDHESIQKQTKDVRMQTLYEYLDEPLFSKVEFELSCDNGKIVGLEVSTKSGQTSVAFGYDNQR
jgi:hypothetical protein